MRRPRARAGPDRGRTRRAGLAWSRRRSRVLQRSAARLPDRQRGEHRRCDASPDRPAGLLLVPGVYHREAAKFGSNGSSARVMSSPRSSIASRCSGAPLRVGRPWPPTRRTRRRRQDSSHTMAALLLGDERRLISDIEYCTVDSVARFLGENRPSPDVRSRGRGPGRGLSVILLDGSKAHRSVFGVLLRPWAKGASPTGEPHGVPDERDRPHDLEPGHRPDGHPRRQPWLAAWDQRCANRAAHFRPVPNRLTGLFTFVPSRPSGRRDHGARSVAWPSGTG